MDAPGAHATNAASEGVAGPLRVFTLDPAWDHDRWVDFLAGHEEAHAYHHPLWLELLRRAFGHRVEALTVEDAAGRLCGLLPLVVRRSGRRRLVLSSLPHTPVAGPLARDEQSLRALVRAVVDHVQARNGRLLLKTSAPLPPDVSEHLVRAAWDATYVRELPARPEELRFGDSRTHGAIARGVRKARREGVEVRAATGVADVRRWYPLYLEAMRAHAVPPRPLRFFEIAWETLAEPGLMRLLLAEHWDAGRPPRLLSGSIFFLFGGTVFYAFNGRLRSRLVARPNDAIHWAALESACREGFRRFDFGEVTPSQHGLAAYKAKWGARPVPLYRYHYPKPTTADRLLRPESRAHRLAAVTWQRLPIGVTQTIGELLYR